MNETHLATKTRRTYIVITLLGSLLALSVYVLAQSVQEEALPVEYWPLAQSVHDVTVPVAY